MIFARQVEALAEKGDVCIGISTSGNSENVYKGLLAGYKKDAHLIGLLGNEGGKIALLDSTKIIIRYSNTARIQEMHILIGHIICEIEKTNCIIQRNI